LSRQAFEEETSGFFLIEQGSLPQGWRKADRTEAGPIRGKCVYATGDANGTRPEDKKGPHGNGPDMDQDDKDKKKEPEPCPPDGATTPGQPTGLAQYNFHLMLASLHIYDIPVGCNVPLGPSSYFKVTYNSREANQPQSFTFSNMGSRWLFSWLSYVEDDPTDVGGPVDLYKRGGGKEPYDGFVNGVSLPQTDVRAEMEIVSASPIVYERHLSSGAVEVFSESDGAATAPRKIFLTGITDSAGNTLTFTYDEELRLVSATDAIGRVTTVSYELEGDPLKITTVTDPYDRSAHFEYDDLGRLIKIIDVIGMSSEFEYDGSDFIRALTTPYGKTSFRKGNGPYKE
jgi:YD repeat-containing protein